MAKTAKLKTLYNPRNPDEQWLPRTTKEAVGLANVDNTADMDKPVSTAMQEALSAKADKLDHTAEQIDSAVSRALPGGDIDVSIQKKPNPNLLDDCYFAKPVDQRQGRVVVPNTTYYSDNTLTTPAGTTSAYVTAYRYTTGTASGVSYASFKMEDSDTAPTYYAAPENVVRGYTGVGYGIDRWLSHEASNTTLIYDDHITISRQHAQVIDNYANLVGKQVTISALTNLGLITATGVCTNNDGTQVYYNDGNGHDIVIYNNGSYHGFQVNNTKGGTLNLYAAKIELGSQQTLAHQDDNGNWALNEIPDYGEQLARCQRYCLVIGRDDKYCPVGTGQARTTSNYQLHIPLPVSLRTFPTITKIGKMWVRNQEGVIFLTSLNFHHNLSQNCISLECSGDSAFIPGTFYESFTIPGGKLVISADL